MAKTVIPLRQASILIPEELDEVARWIAENEDRGFAEVLREAITKGLPQVEGYAEAVSKWQAGQAAPRFERTGGAKPKPGSRRTVARTRTAGKATSRRAA